MSTLYIVATPIGNLDDVTLRALRILSEVDAILCEDTRVTRKLLVHYHIEKPLISYHEHSKLQKIKAILELLKEGKDLALVCDAGTPGISDPGNKLVSVTIQQCSNVTIVPVPGASALTAIASITGFPMDKFVFLGFPPAKKGRKKFFGEVLATPYPVILYESPHRIIKTLQELQSLSPFYDVPHTQIVVGCELTKKFETIYRGTIKEALSQFYQLKPRGEFVVAVSRHPYSKF